MNGANLHETGVRQMGRAEGGGRGDEEGGRGGVVVEEEEGEGGNRHRVNVSHRVAVKWWMLGRNLQVPSQFNCKKWHIWQRCLSLSDQQGKHKTINLMKFLVIRLITLNASERLFQIVIFCRVRTTASVRSTKPHDFCNIYIHRNPF